MALQQHKSGKESILTNWSCDKCGKCCEVVGEKYGEHCPSYDMSTKLCKNYDTRPEICRVSITKENNEDYKKLCEFLKGGG